MCGIYAAQETYCKFSGVFDVRMMLGLSLGILTVDWIWASTVSPPPSPAREERPVVPQPGVGLLEEEGQALPPAPVRLEIIGIGEEEEIVELEELVRGGVDDAVAGGEEVDEGGEDVAEAPILGPQERRVRGVAPGERGELADRLDPEVPGPIQGPLLQDASGWSDIDMFFLQNK